MSERRVTPGGWRRAVAGLLVGLLAGALVALVLPRQPAAGAGTRGEPPER